MFVDLAEGYKNLYLKKQNASSQLQGGALTRAQSSAKTTQQTDMVEETAETSSSRKRAFSPIPSTSSNLRVSAENEKKFKQQKIASLRQESDNLTSSDNAPILSASSYIFPQKDFLFNEKTKVFETKNLEVFVIKEAHQKQKIFRAEDHLYILRIKQKKKGPPPFLKDIQDVLFHALKFMMNTMKDFYSPAETNIVYMTIYQEQLNSAINSPYFVLQEDKVISFLPQIFNSIQMGICRTKAAPANRANWMLLTK